MYMPEVVLSLMALMYSVNNKISKTGESVAQMKSTCSQKPKLCTIEYSQQMDRRLLCAGLCAHPEISLESSPVQTLQKSLR